MYIILFHNLLYQFIASNDTYEPIENYDSVAAVTLIHHDGDKLSTRQITSIESLKEVLHKHEKVPMDDPQDRGDLYILAPMRILSPILEESTEQNCRENDLNKSLMTVISEILQPTNRQNSVLNSNNTVTNNTVSYPDGHFQDSIESTSSLVQIIEEIRNNSLCNLYCADLLQKQPQQKNKIKNQPAPQVPRRNNDNNNPPNNGGLGVVPPKQVEKQQVLILFLLANGCSRLWYSVFGH